MSQFKREQDLFNEAYIRATKTSNPEDYFNAALLARQLVDCLECERALSKDSYDEMLHRVEKENTND